MPQASPSPCFRTSTPLAEFASLPLALAWCNLLTAQCPALRFEALEARDSRQRAVWELDARDSDPLQPASAEQWARAWQILADPATACAVSQLVMAQRSVERLGQLALDIEAECLAAIADLEDTGTTHRILLLLSRAGFVAVKRSENSGRLDLIVDKDSGKR